MNSEKASEEINKSIRQDKIELNDFKSSLSEIYSILELQREEIAKKLLLRLNNNIIKKYITNMSIQLQLNKLAEDIHKCNHKWWHDSSGSKIERNKGELLCLIHSEISEAMEGERKNLMDDKLPHRKMAEVELADALIRILDYSAGFGYDIEGAVKEKLEYNLTRKDHTYEEREGPNGKKW